MVIFKLIEYLIYPPDPFFTTEKSSLFIIDVSAIYVLTTNLNLGDSSGAIMARWESFVGRPSLSVDGDHVGGEGEEVVARLADHSRVPGPLRGWGTIR